MVRVLLVSEHRVVRQGMRALLATAAGMRVVGEADPREDVVRPAVLLRPDVLVLYTDLFGADRLGLCRVLRSHAPETHLLILAAQADAWALEELARTRLGSVVGSGADHGGLIAAINAAQRGEIFVAPPILVSLPEAEAPAAEAPPALQPGVRLTAREAQVLRLLAEGHTNAQAAERLGIGTRTVETHRANLATKLGVHSRADLVRCARSLGLTA